MHRRVACCIVGLLVVASVVAPAAAATTPDEAIGMPEEFDPDSVSLSAALQADGDADWQFTYRMRLTNENETAAFEELQDDVQANTSTYVDRFRSRITETVASAESATGRNMSVGNVSVSTRVNSLNEDSLGVVTYSFEWGSFAAVEGDTVAAGDALEGFYLDNETSLTVSWPDGYEAAEIDPEGERPREDAVVWSGPLEFGAGQPSVVVAPSDEETTTEDNTVDLTDTEGGPSDANSGGAPSLATLAGGLLVVLAVAGGGWLYWSRNGRDEGDGPVPTPGDTGGGGAAAAAADDGDEDAGEPSESEQNEPPAELLSNEERVERFLESQGGRAKQQAVVEELGWTEAKTSQVVKQMREDDQLESFRIGRENVLKLPDADDLDE
ncbi:helix-turn-helix transcriptional regulator [Halobacterium litoreum]|uniref:Helix-turn-helix transcriptional regulator n=1 Tax=Halobacterium litoreum TaxID=2039234 RepID=A0ABD5NI83_9EURY|nr:hypothetical protein [Halobacterium litoreum]UHH12289.1 hypothetical protein LT972_08975 [Halobacterium litoreum]